MKSFLRSPFIKRASASAITFLFFIFVRLFRTRNKGVCSTYTCPFFTSSGKNCKKNVMMSKRICMPSTSASVATITLLYLNVSSPSSISSAACSKLNSSFSYTTFLVSPYELSGLPRSENTACVFTSRLLVILPLAESPSVIKIELSSLRSFFASLKCARQSRSFLLCKLAFLALSRAILVTPAMAFRSRSLSSILRFSSSATSAWMCKKLSTSRLMKSPTYLLTLSPPGLIVNEPSLIFV